MDNFIFLEASLVFIRWTVPVVAVLSLVLFVRPKLFSDLEKKLSVEIGSKKISRKTIELLEKENMSLHQTLIRHNRAAGLFCFILSLIIISRIFL